MVYIDTPFNINSHDLLKEELQDFLTRNLELIENASKKEQFDKKNSISFE